MFLLRTATFSQHILILYSPKVTIMLFIIYLVASVALQGMAEASGSPGFHRRDHDPAKDIHLGTPGSLDEFFERMGTHSSDWFPVEPAGQDDLQQEPLSDQPDGRLDRREGKCEGKTGVEYYACEALPNRWYTYAAGGAAIVYFGPRILDGWLDDAARFYYNGFNFGAR